MKRNPQVDITFSEKIKKWGIQYINRGVTEELTVVEKRMIRLVNLGAILGIPGFLIFALMYYGINAEVFMPVLISVTLFIPLFIVSAVLNGKNKHLASAVILNISFTITLFVPLVLFLGDRGGNHYFFLMFTLFPILTFKPKNIFWIVVTSALNIVAFYWMDNYGTLGADLSYYAPREFVKGSRFVSLYSCLFSMMVIVGMNQRYINASENELSAKTIRLINALEHLKELATIDSLTGSFNRTYFDHKIELEIAAANRYKTPLSLILIDLDYFKGINDTFGHDVGDMVLKTSADVFDCNIRVTDALIRWGGEEFLIIAPQTDYEGAMQLAEKLRGSLAATPQPHFGAITGSFGVTTFEEDDTFEDLYKRMDQALYRAKNLGRNKVEGILKENFKEEHREK